MAPNLSIGTIFKQIIKKLAQNLGTIFRHINPLLLADAVCSINRHSFKVKWSMRGCFETKLDDLGSSKFQIFPYFFQSLFWTFGAWWTWNLGFKYYHIFSKPVLNFWSLTILDLLSFKDSHIFFQACFELSELDDLGS